MKKTYRIVSALMSAFLCFAAVACGEREGITSDNWEISSTSGEAKPGNVEVYAYLAGTQRDV